MRRQALEKLVQDLVRSITASEATTTACCDTDSCCDSDPDCCPEDGTSPRARAACGPVVVVCTCTCGG